ncbi:histidine phosphatase superfamily [Lipomyces oligophaga]|uniref:histidine phosphatase superfamily n=1 Tax=Lipomyces oligophaga TaxID=45792 RepID=UPI0034CEB2AB
MGPPILAPSIDIKDQYPSNLQLNQVQIIFRHGERTPVHRTLQQWDKWGFPIFWPLCQSSCFSLTGIVNPNAQPHLVSAFPYEREIETTTGETPSKLFTNAGKEGICLEGQLTDKGRLSSYKLGEQIRALYIERLAFLPRTFVEQEDVYLRTTSIVRARETLQQVFAGIYPFSKASVPPKIYERFPFEENLYPTTGPCPRLRELMVQFIDASAKKWDPLLIDAAKGFAPILSSESKTITVGSSKESDNSWALIDTYASALAHNIPTPPCFNDRKAVNLLARASLDADFSGFEFNSEMQKLGMGRFFDEVLTRMIRGDRVVSRNEAEIVKMLDSKKDKLSIWRKPKLALYGAHDSSIGALLATMGVLDRKWINFTSHIVFEHFQETDQTLGKSSWLSTAKPKEYVRIRYNGQPLDLPACSAAGDHLEGQRSLCTMEAFTEFVKRVSPKDYTKECNENLKTPPPEDDVVKALAGIDNLFRRE